MTTTKKLRVKNYCSQGNYWNTIFDLNRSVFVLTSLKKKETTQKHNEWLTTTQTIRKTMFKQQLDLKCIRIYRKLYRNIQLYKVYCKRLEHFPRTRVILKLKLSGRSQREFRDLKVSFHIRLNICNLKKSLWSKCHPYRVQRSY